MVKTTNVEMYDIAGVDLRNDEPFEIQIAVDANTSVELYYTQRGYMLTKAECVGTRLFLSSCTATQTDSSPATLPAPAAANPQPALPETLKKPRGPYKKKAVTINPEFEAAVVEMVKQIEQDEPPAPEAKEPAKKPAKPPAEPVIEPTQERLLTFYGKHGAGSGLQVSAASEGKLTRDEVKDMANGHRLHVSKYRILAAVLDKLEELDADREAKKAAEEQQVEADT